MPSCSTFSKRLREARLRAGLSQMALGVAAGIDEFSASPRINQYERGKHLPDPRTVAKLAEVLDVAPPYFFAAEEDLAELLTIWNRLKPSARRRLLENARTAAGN